MSEPVMIVIAVVVLAVVVLAVVASMLRRALSAAMRALSSLVGLAAIVFVVCLIAGVDMSGLRGWVSTLALPHLRAWWATR
jgi:F0F1-type ATP synthase membrane subunit a